jgi:pyridoxal phosphate enzyme (YggS family)
MMPPASSAHTADATAIAANLAHVHARMAAAATHASRNPADVTLVAVSKTHPLAAIAVAATAGQRDFGENRLEELWEKVESAHAQGITGLRWHMIGPIQSRKSNQAIGPFGPFALIHAVDRTKIAQRLSRDAEATSCVLSVLLEVNVSGESTKHGFAPDDLRKEIVTLAKLPALRIEGLMTMAPLVNDPETVRPVFRDLRLLRDQLAQATGLPLPQLSMGMSGDFEVAIEEGATLVRVGSAIFGARL